MGKKRGVGEVDPGGLNKCNRQFKKEKYHLLPSPSPWKINVLTYLPTDWLTEYITVLKLLTILLRFLSFALFIFILFLCQTRRLWEACVQVLRREKKYFPLKLVVQPRVFNSGAICTATPSDLCIPGIKTGSTFQQSIKAPGKM